MCVIHCNIIYQTIYFSITSAFFFFKSFLVNFTTLYICIIMFSFYSLSEGKVGYRVHGVGYASGLYGMGYRVRGVGYARGWVRLV